VTAEQVRAKNPAAIILSGGPSSVYEDGSPQLDPQILELGVPVLGICYGFQTLANLLGGRVDRSGIKEYGATELRVSDGGEILEGQPAEQICWMSHGDQVMQAPEGFEVLASTDITPVAAFANNHLTVQKDTSGEFTESSVHRLLGEERAAEMARLLSGLSDSDTGLAHARELLAMAGQH
jgi:GMP synthase (glutamine-hydrolysing) A subunit